MCASLYCLLGRAIELHLHLLNCSQPATEAKAWSKQQTHPQAQTSMEKTAVTKLITKETGMHPQFVGQMELWEGSFNDWNQGEWIQELWTSAGNYVPEISCSFSQNKRYKGNQSIILRAARCLLRLQDDHIQYSSRCWFHQGSTVLCSISIFWNPCIQPLSPTSAPQDSPIKSTSKLPVSVVL